MIRARILPVRIKMKPLILPILIGSMALVHTMEAKSLPITSEQVSSQPFTKVADKAIPATVFIKVSMIPERGEMMSGFDNQAEEFFRRFFGEPMQQVKPEPQMAQGSGFLISPDGYIVTNHHVIRNATEITVKLSDDREYKATLKGSDPRTELALLKIEEKNLPYLNFGDSDSLKVGEWVAATGNPGGLEATLTVGVVSGKGRQDLGIVQYEDFIQTDAAINPGNSGGPLLTMSGEVVGINTALLTRTGGFMGIGLAVPSKIAKNVISQLMDNGTVKKAYLGVAIQPIDKELSSALSLEKEEGLLVSDIVKNSPAEKAGLKSGDIITEYNGKAIKSIDKFVNEIGILAPGTEVKLQIHRNNKPLSITAISEAQDEETAFSEEILQKLGLGLENLTPDTCDRLGYKQDTTGVIISKVKPNSPAAKAGLKPGILITGIALSAREQTRVKNTTELEEALKKLKDKKHVAFMIRNQNFQRYCTVKLD